MSEPTDIKALEEYLKGGSEVSQRYRELGRDDVPPELDRRVLEQARAAVAHGGARRAKSLLRWSAPLALAASIVLVVTVVIENGVPKDAAYVVQPASEESQLYDQQPAQDRQFVPEAPAAQPAAPPVPPAEPARERSLAKAEAENRGSSERVQEQVAAPEETKVQAKARHDQEQSAPVTSVAAVDAAEPRLATQNVAAPTPRALERGEAETDSDVDSVAVSGSRARRATGRTAGPRNTVSGVSLRGEMRESADAGADTAAQAEQPEPEKWLEDIRELRRKGRIADADSEWQRFTEAYPDFEVADDDIARKH